MKRIDSESLLRALIDDEERRRLSRPRTGRVLRDVTFLWAQIFLVWTAAWWIDAIWFYAIAVILAGNRYYALYVIGHDGLHRILHKEEHINDAINDILILGPVGAITRINRHNHMQHHRHLGGHNDPDTFKYKSRSHLSPVMLLISFSGAPLVVRAIKNVFDPAAHGNVLRPAYRPRDLFILVSWQAALLCGLTGVFGWWGYPLLWLLPIAAFTLSFDLLRVFSEHSVQDDSGLVLPHERMIMVVSSPQERLFFSPMNMNHHVTHHAWPTIPYYALPEATSLMQQRAEDAGIHIEYRAGYCSYLLSVFRGTFQKQPTAE